MKQTETYPTQPNNDPVNHPQHYQSANGVECIDALEAATEFLSGIEAICIGNTIKYLWRFTKKGKPLEDLKKARFYLDKVIARYSNAQVAP